MEPGKRLSAAILHLIWGSSNMTPINLEMQIIDPEDCRGALRSECSFDGVEFKRIIMVWGMKTETVVKLDPL